MIGYVTVGTNDLDRARAYYDALFGSIGGRRLMQLEDQRGFTMYGVAMNRPSVVVTRPYDGRAADPGNGTMTALVMDSMEKVDAFHAKALELGGSNEGDPGFRGDAKLGYYFAYFRDLDGNKFAVFNISPQA
ncbi:VOC family protein [Sphingomonas sp. SM33]|uniref:VOC family protein n=1 Tax=Sphingomonas telluris TaxID=2907998 RepID=A0ABS9VQK9_9SPHN|nr:VOC family protein [Sphingomonas telluris]MCH8617243.1 VOC family protein [Sphingomonas telluris]